MRLNAFRLNQHGMARLFGGLEARVMNVVWKLGECTVHDVTACLGDAANYKTVLTVMNRLVAKGFLARRKVSRAFVYAACVEREALIERLTREVFGGLIADFGPAVLEQFVEVVAASGGDQLADLAALVEAHLSAVDG